MEGGDHKNLIAPGAPLLCLQTPLCHPLPNPLWAACVMVREASNMAASHWMGYSDGRKGSLEESRDRKPQCSHVSSMAVQKRTQHTKIERPSSHTAACGWGGEMGSSHSGVNKERGKAHLGGETLPLPLSLCIGMNVVNLLALA